eukprot:scaffold7377_cov389-Prasinococcus_capsulatus_cf.AAC.37
MSARATCHFDATGRVGAAGAEPPCGSHATRARRSGAPASTPRGPRQPPIGCRVRQRRVAAGGVTKHLPLDRAGFGFAGRGAAARRPALDEEWPSLRRPQRPVPIGRPRARRVGRASGITAALRSEAGAGGARPYISDPSAADTRTDPYVVHTDPIASALAGRRCPLPSPTTRPVRVVGYTHHEVFQALPAGDAGIRSASAARCAVAHCTASAAEASIQEEPVAERKVRDNAEKHEFQAEVARLMDIIINSLYSNKDIFLRELISNASDALDKIRYMALTDPDALGEGETRNLDIKVKIDKEKRVLSLTDKGIGMTKDELVRNLGTIAKSGTSTFLDKMSEGADMNLIGQFGVGFYSVYLVADYVEVISKNNNDDKQHIWESAADGNFAVSEDTENESLGRGTEIRIYLKEEASEYLEESKIEELVGKYSEFINFPIYLWKGHEVDVEVPVEEDEESEEADTEDDETEENEDDEDDEDEDEDDLPKTKTIKETQYDWELLNDSKAIWLRNPKEVEEDDYNSFYKSLTKDYKDPLAYSHFNAEGDVEFKAILFIPSSAPHDLFDNYYNAAAALKLYVRRVFISDEFDELIPKYLSFIKGIVDSDTLPLNVSREMLQQHSSLKTIKKKLVRKALDMIRKLAEADQAEEEDEEEEDEVEDEVEDEDEDEELEEDEGEDKYAEFWKNYGKSIKLGIIEDSSNRTRLAKLLRFYTSKSEDKLVSLEEYIDRMKDDQKNIYYVAGESVEELKGSPFIEKLIAEDYEVIFFTDPIDEYTMQNLTEFEDKKFQNASKEDMKIGEKDDAAKEQEKKVKEKFKELTKWWKEQLDSSEVESVKVSTRLTTTPCAVVTSKYGWSANMERIMKAQALSDDNRGGYMKSKKTLEINPKHPMIKELRDKVAETPDDETLADTAKVLYEVSLLESGFAPGSPKEFATRVFGMMKTAMGIDADAVIETEPEDEIIEDPEPEEDEEVGDEDGEEGDEEPPAKDEL